MSLLTTSLLTQKSKPAATVRVEFMPGRIAEMPAGALTKPPKFVICRLVRQANGSYVTVPVEWSPVVRMTRELHRDLGLPCSYRTLYKLVKSGLVAGLLPSPYVLMIDIASLIDHFEATRIDPDRPKFWTRQRIESFRNAEGPLTDLGDD